MGLPRSVSARIQHYLYMGNRLRSAGVPPAAANSLLPVPVAPIGFETLSDPARLEAIIAPVVTGLGFALVRVQLNGRAPAITLQVMAEDAATGQLTLDQCAAISRALDEPLEAADPIEGEYALEVSSPGIDRPLTRPADWERWVGHDVRLKVAAPLAAGPGAGRVAMKGVVAGFAGGAALVDLPDGRLSLPLAEIAGAKLVLTNKLIAASRPLDMAGADETLEDLPEDGESLSLSTDNS